MSPETPPDDDRLDDADPPDAADPETPDEPLGVPEDADEESPGFQRDAPNAG